MRIHSMHFKCAIFSIYGFDNSLLFAFVIIYKSGGIGFVYDCLVVDSHKCEIQQIIAPICRLYTLLWLNRWLHMLSFSGLARISTAWSYYRSHRIASLYFMGYYGCSFYVDDQSLGYAWTMMCYKSIERIWTHSFSATSAAFFFVKLWHRLCFLNIHSKCYCSANFRQTFHFRLQNNSRPYSLFKNANDNDKKKRVNFTTSDIHTCPNINNSIAERHYSDSLAHIVMTKFLPT